MKKRPFKVALLTANIIKVIGTSFNIRAFNKDRFSSNQMLFSGKVVFYPDNNEKEGCIFLPGQRGVFNIPNNNIRMVENRTDSNVIAWKTGHLYFTGKTLTNIISPLKIFIR